MAGNWLTGFIIYSMKIEKVRILFTNIYYIQTGNTGFLIDSGYPLSEERFFKKINNLGKIDYLVLTHTHFDHSGNAIYLKKRGVKIVVHREEEKWLLDGETPRPPGVKGIGKTAIRFSALKSFKFPPVKPDIVVSNWLKMEDLLIVHTPGHTPGSVSIVMNNIAFCGDLIMNLTWRPFSHIPIFAHNMDEVKDSIKMLLDMGIEKFYPSHGRPVNFNNLKI